MPREGSAGDDAAFHDGESSLGDWMDRQFHLSAAAMLQSVSAIHLVKERPGFGQTIRPVKGSVLASPMIASYDPDPDYFFHWLRDSAIVIDAVGVLIEERALARDALDDIRDFLRFSLALCDLDGRGALRSGASLRAANPAFQQYMRSAPELSGVVGDAVFGETRVNPDGTLDITKWARPQHDGPALRALTVMRLWRRGFFDDPDTRAVARALVDADLAFTHRRWTAPSFDIWEEELGHHYYTRLVQYAALADGAEWLDEIAGDDCAHAYRTASREIARRLDGHWDADRGFYLSRLGATADNMAKELDCATILAVIHARRGAGPHSVTDPRALATLGRLENLFIQDYPINKSLPPGRGPAMGRYSGDLYYSGGAYYFSTLAAAEFFFRLAGAVAGRAQVPAALDGQSLLAGVIADPSDGHSGFDALISRGDGFMATVRAYAPASGALSEQFDRATGRQTSAKNLAWSHAALITAVASRRAAFRAVDPL
ncbi:glycoside hydrolase family 15 protein [Methylocapsa sp. S129]|uniref:glycoside hydrolase family 15 protein n=1 Tax=Methylocapsa sp. S129 TaxID=1641869 RepID=UPI00131E0219|nr:glycoside hydrolase family 15 protein [Methylocapsa sp. S129]